MPKKPCKKPNKETLAAIKEKGGREFKTAEELFDYLGIATKSVKKGRKK